jgi:hypothetical protein
VLRVDNFVLDHQLHNHVETEQQLILVEESAAHFDLEKLQKGHVNVVDSFHVVILARFSFGASIFKLHFVPDQGLLLHMVDLSHVGQCEEQERGLLRQLGLLLTLDFYLTFSDLCQVLGLFDLGCLSFGFLKFVD